MSFHAQAERQMARKYGANAWEWMPYWGKVRNRLSQANYQGHNQRMLWVAMVVPAVVASLAVSVIAVVLRG